MALDLRDYVGQVAEGFLDSHPTPPGGKIQRQRSFQAMGRNNWPPQSAQESRRDNRARHRPVALWRPRLMAVGPRKHEFTSPDEGLLLFGRFFPKTTHFYPLRYQLRHTYRKPHAPTVK